jgi:hypothetical protein
MFQKLVYFCLFNFVVAFNDRNLNFDFTEPAIRVCRKPLFGRVYIKLSSESVDEVDVASTKYDVIYGKPCLIQYLQEDEPWEIGRVTYLKYKL